MSKKNSVIDYLRSVDLDDLVDVWNVYCSEVDNFDEEIYPNDDATLDEMFPSAYKFARSAKYGDYDFRHDYFTFNGYGNIVSFNYLDDDNCPIDLDGLADWFIENGDSDLEIDSDFLQGEFLDEYFPNSDDYDKAMYIADNLSESEPIDYLMDEWDDIAETIKSHWND